MVEYLEINKIISDRQYGFRESRSTTDFLTNGISLSNNMAYAFIGQGMARESYL